MTNPKCLGTSFPDTFSARSAHLTGLKMRRITRAASSFDHLVGAQQERFGDCQPERLGCCKINNEIELGRLLDRNFARLCPAKNLVDIIGGASERVRDVWSVGHQTSHFDVLTEIVNRRQSRGEPIVLARRPTMFDPDAAPSHKAGLFKAFEKSRVDGIPLRTRV